MPHECGLVPVMVAYGAIHRDIPKIPIAKLLLELPSEGSKITG